MKPVQKKCRDCGEWFEKTNGSRNEKRCLSCKAKTQHIQARWTPDYCGVPEEFSIDNGDHNKE